MAFGFSFWNGVERIVAFEVDSGVVRLDHLRYCTVTTEMGEGYRRCKEEAG